MVEISKRNQVYEIIASGQNDISQSELLQKVGSPKIIFTLNKTLKNKTAIGLVVWFAITIVKGCVAFPKIFKNIDKKKTILIVHGDTISTVMGAMLGKLFCLKVAHIEAGLRSQNFLQPFPEEIDRFIVSFLADIHFCPYPSAIKNLKNRSGKKVDTEYNTNIDSLQLARTILKSNLDLPTNRKKPYFIFILHRQENLLNNRLIKDLIEILIRVVSQLDCIFITHELTEKRLRQTGLYKKVTTHPNIYIIRRKPYFEFINLLDKSEFIMTDGGGNQQESYYLGKPCLLLREITESEEGIGSNVCISKNDSAIITDFMLNYQHFRFPEIQPNKRPSEIIVNTLMG